MWATARAAIYASVACVPMWLLASNPSMDEAIKSSVGVAAVTSIAAFWAIAKATHSKKEEQE